MFSGLMAGITVVSEEEATEWHSSLFAPILPITVPDGNQVVFFSE